MVNQLRTRFSFGENCVFKSLDMRVDFLNLWRIGCFDALTLVSTDKLGEAFKLKFVYLVFKNIRKLCWC